MLRLENAITQLLIITKNKNIVAYRIQVINHSREFYFNIFLRNAFSLTVTECSDK